MAQNSGGGGNDMPWLHYIGTVDILPSGSTAYTYELPLDIDIDTVSGFIGIPHSLANTGNMPSVGIPQVNDHYNKTPTDSAAHGFSDPASNFRYDAENKKIILYIGTWKGVYTGLMDLCYMLKED